MMIRKFRKNMVLALGMTAFLYLRCGVFADEATKQRFLADYPSKAKYLSDRFDHCQGRYLLEWEENGKRMEMDVDFFRSHGFDKVEIKMNTVLGGKKHIGINVYCLDATTGFMVGRMGDEPKWKLFKVSQSQLEREVFEMENAQIIRSPLGGFQKSLVEMMDAGEIKLIDAQVPTDRPTEVEATFRVDGDTPLKQIVANFDPRNHWAVTRQAISVGSPLRVAMDYRVEYGTNLIDGVRIPVRVHVKQHNSRFEISEWRFAEIPREQFLLPYYGLPDVISAKKPKRFGWFEWSILAAIAGAIALGFIFLWLSKRQDDVTSASA